MKELRADVYLRVDVPPGVVRRIRARHGVVQHCTFDRSTVYRKGDLNEVLPNKNHGPGRDRDAFFQRRFR